MSAAVSRYLGISRDCDGGLSRESLTVFSQSWVCMLKLDVISGIRSQLEAWEEVIRVLCMCMAKAETG